MYFLNSENRSYKERITNVDSLGRKRTVSEHYTAASWIMQENKFDYKNNRLVLAEFEEMPTIKCCCGIPTSTMI